VGRAAVAVEEQRAIGREHPPQLAGTGVEELRILLVTRPQIGERKLLAAVARPEALNLLSEERRVEVDEPCGAAIPLSKFRVHG
jgi:hypothetical protein